MKPTDETQELIRRSTAAGKKVVGQVAAWLIPRRLKVFSSTIALVVWGGWLVSLWRGSSILDAFGNVVGGDFMAFYTGGRFLLEGRLAQLYDLSAQQFFQGNIGVSVATQGFIPFLNPPFAVILYAPFAGGSFLQGLSAWWLWGSVCFVLAIVTVHRELTLNWKTATTYSPLPFLSLKHWFLYALVFYPTMTWVMFGQITGMLLLLFAATFVLLRRRHDFAAGLVWGLLLLKPQLAMTLTVILLVKWRWRTLLGSATTVSGLLATGLMIGWQPFYEYLQFSTQLMDILRMDGYKTWGLHSLYGFSILLFNDTLPQLTQPVTYLLMLLGLGGLSIIWLRTPWLPGVRRWDMTMAATIAAGLLISPHLYVYDLMLLLLPLAIVWRCYADRWPPVILDGGPILIMTALVYAATFLGTYFSLLQATVATWLGLPKVVVQTSVPLLILWVYFVLRAAVRLDSAVGDGPKAQPNLPEGAQRPFGPGADNLTALGAPNSRGAPDSMISGQPRMAIAIAVTWISRSTPRQCLRIRHIPAIMHSDCGLDDNQKVFHVHGAHDRAICPAGGATIPSGLVDRR